MRPMFWYVQHGRYEEGLATSLRFPSSVVVAGLLNSPESFCSALHGACQAPSKCVILIVESCWTPGHQDLHLSEKAVNPHGTMQLPRCHFCGSCKKRPWEISVRCQDLVGDLNTWVTVLKLTLNINYYLKLENWHVILFIYGLLQYLFTTQFWGHLVDALHNLGVKSACDFPESHSDSCHSDTWPKTWHIGLNIVYSDMNACMTDFKRLDTQTAALEGLRAEYVIFHAWQIP